MTFHDHTSFDIPSFPVKIQLLALMTGRKISTRVDLGQLSEIQFGVFRS